MLKVREEIKGLTRKELMNKAYYHYHDKLNTFYEYPQEKDLRIKIEEIIPRCCKRHICC